MNTVDKKKERKTENNFVFFLNWMVMAAFRFMDQWNRTDLTELTGEKSKPINCISKNNNTIALLAKRGLKITRVIALDVTKERMHVKEMTI